MITKAYLCFRGAWECVPPGFQFKTVGGRVTGCIWSYEAKTWFGQQYGQVISIFKFTNRGDAELYVKAANEESRIEASSNGTESISLPLDELS
jgi:hypothetical protein